MRFRFEVELTKIGINWRINQTLRYFWWKPYSPMWIDKNGNIIKSKRFQYLKFTL